MRKLSRPKFSHEAYYVSCYDMRSSEKIGVAMEYCLDQTSVLSLEKVAMAVGDLSRWNGHGQGFDLTSPRFKQST